MARNAVLQVRNNTAVDWSTSNLILAAGEFGQEIDTGKLKVGNGVLAWNVLPYINSDGSTITVAPQPPEGAVDGNQWLDSNSMIMYVYYDSYWIDVSSTISAALPVGQYDGGAPDSVYGGITAINAGSI